MKKLGKYSEHRMAALRNLAINLIKHKRIITTVGKAKALRPFIEKLVTKAKYNNLSNGRLLLSRLYNNQEAVNEIFNIGQTCLNRPGGYTRIIRLGGINERVLIEFVDYHNE